MSGFASRRGYFRQTLLRGGPDFRRDFRGRGFSERLANRNLSRRLYGRPNRFDLDRRLFGLGHFDPAGATPDDVGAHPALHDRFARLDFPQRFILGLYHTVRDNFFFADVDLGFFLSR
ncbi:MAG TPA: hypothetical protein VI699_06055 [Candidatus Acidoferrales bacterium]|nr:hypothetical protein [Candidatus Acidoferrales bacterium]